MSFSNRMQLLNKDHFEMLLQGPEGPWNEWRQANPEIDPNLQGAQLIEADLNEMDLSWANLSEADLSRANLQHADLHSTILTKADLSGANLRFAEIFDAKLNWAQLENTDLTKAELGGAEMFNANLKGANLSEADLTQVNLGQADLTGACLRGAQLMEADLINAILPGADLSFANLSEAKLINADMTDANLQNSILVNASLVGAEIENAKFTGSHIFGISAWGLFGEPKEQSNLVITQSDEPSITVDNLEVAQFIYILLHNEKIRDVIDTVTSKVVLILGRFSQERKLVLDALREELRKHDYLPVLFDFNKPSQRDLTETISTLAHMSRFIVADITDARSIPQELHVIIPNLPSVPVLPLLVGSSGEYSMFDHLKRFPWVLDTVLYETSSDLVKSIKERIIIPAEEKIKEIHKRD